MIISPAVLQVFELALVILVHLLKRLLRQVVHLSGILPQLGLEDLPNEPRPVIVCILRRDVITKAGQHFLNWASRVKPRVLAKGPQVFQREPARAS